LTNSSRKAVLVRNGNAALIPADQARAVHLYVAISGDTLEDMTQPGYFDALAPRLRRYDRIEVASDDDNLFAEFLVVEASNLGVRVLGLRGGPIGLADQLGAPGAAMRRDGELHVIYKGPHLKWCCLRGNEVLRDRFETEALALAWLNDHARTTGKGAA
jgi:hypothetical protein